MTKGNLNKIEKLRPKLPQLGGPLSMKIEIPLLDQNLLGKVTLNVKIVRRDLLQFLKIL